jgi:hypothetical protein
MMNQRVGVLCPICGCRARRPEQEDGTFGRCPNDGAWMQRLPARTRRQLDDRPGEMPDIQSRDGSITYGFARTGPARNTRLLIRVDSDQNLWAAIDIMERPLHRHGKSGVPPGR